jgi:hypothetical protein
MSADANYLRLESQVRALRRYAVVATAVLVMLVLGAFVHAGRARFTEITVERINVVGPDGRYAVVISNTERMVGNVMSGREYDGGRRGSGLIFYNADGNEAGGLIFDSTVQDSLVYAVGQLSLDRFESDQVAVLRYSESPEGWEAGLQVSHLPRHNLVEWFAARDTIERLPTQAARDSAMQALRRRFFREGKWEIPRLFAGERGRTALLELRDTRGRERARLVVDSLDVARLEFLDESGRVTLRLPE